MQARSLNPAVRQRFELEQELRRDGNGFSWLARDRADGNHYVLKTLALVRVPSLEDLAQRLTRLSEPLHPALVRPYGWAPGDDHVAIWRPHVEGPDSSSLCRAPLDRILAAAQRVAEALHGAHAQGLVHGALHPGNVILDPKRGASVVDFAPVAPGEPAADVAGLGGLLYYWLTGTEAAAGAGAEALAASLREALRPELRIPPRLGRLVVAMRSADEARRPASMLDVRDLLDDTRLALAGDRPQALEEEWAEASFVPPPAPSPAAAPASSSPPPHRRAVRSAVTLALVLALVLAALFTVVGYLPERVARPEPPAVIATTPEPPAPEPEPPPLSEAELEALLAQREAAQAILDDFIHLQLELEEQQVTQWAERAFAAAVARARQGDEPFRQQQFEAAAEIYGEARGLLEQIAALRPQVVAAALERGAQALDAADAGTAEAAFAQALAIEPDHEAARRGLARAQVLDQVVDLLADAETAEREGRLDDARDRYARIIELDPDTSGAGDALARVERAIVERNFRAAMSRGLNALERGDFAGARSALDRAGSIRPGARAVADALTELARRERDHRIATLEARAADAAAEERWEAARKHYTEMLKLDPNLLVAQQGRRRAELREDLDRRLAAFTAEPAAWWSDAGRSEAASLLYDAHATPDPGPRLEAQIALLAQQLELAEQPVEVTLESDLACEVVVYKVARLGRFESTQLRLLPGRYTAVGTRDGYRDVRREFLVAAGGSPEPVSLRCEEQVFAGGP